MLSELAILAAGFPFSPLVADSASIPLPQHVLEEELDGSAGNLGILEQGGGGNDIDRLVVVPDIPVVQLQNEHRTVSQC